MGLFTSPTDSIPGGSADPAFSSGVITLPDTGRIVIKDPKAGEKDSTTSSTSTSGKLTKEPTDKPVKLETRKKETGPLALVPYYEDEQGDEYDALAKQQTRACHFSRDRDYDLKPIVIAHHHFGRQECDIPCTGEGPDGDASVGGAVKGSCMQSIFFTMENSQPPAGTYDIVANTDLDSDVPLPYFNWVEYKFKRPVMEKTATAHVAAFISNCGPQKRLNWMKKMMDAGVTIHSYGHCMKNKEIGNDMSVKYGSNYNAMKQAIVATYKFTMAFENSETKDYVTEKLFGVYAAGSVPLYDGAPNGKMFGPSHSMLFASDFTGPEDMAKMILYLDKNDTAYEEYLNWKNKGPDDEWTALMDFGNVHSNCRLCIRSADMHRKAIGPVKKGQKEGEKKPEGESLELHVRERGKFWLRKIYLQSYTLEELFQKVDAIIPHDKGSYLLYVQTLWERKRLGSNKDVKELPQKTELEAVFVVPQHWDKEDRSKIE